MKKERRKLYRVKELRRMGLSYIERGKRMFGLKEVVGGSGVLGVVEGAPIIKESVNKRRSWWQRVIEWVKSILRWRK